MKRDKTSQSLFRKALLQRSRHRCEYPSCRRSIPKGYKLEAHHIEGLSYGGTNHLDNGLLLCVWHHAMVHRDILDSYRIDGLNQNHRWRQVELYACRRIMIRLRPMSLLEAAVKSDWFNRSK